jgi:hypothetical protein
VKRRSSAALTGLALTLGGCATVTTGTTQSINVDSEPQQAECTLRREGQALGTVTTPAPLTIRRHASTIQVACKKPGYEDGRVVMNSRYETASAGNFLIGGVIGVMVDSSSGASSRYESNVLVRLTPLSPADAAAVAASARKEPTVEKVAMASPSGKPTAYDGAYSGSAEVMQVNLAERVRHRRQIELRIAGGVGAGTVVHPLCDEPGTLDLRIDAAGNVSGRADTLNTTGCTRHVVAVDGHAESDSLQLAFRFSEPIPVTVARTETAALAAPPPRGPFDGTYSGGVELGMSDIGQVWFRIRGAKATGTTRIASCPRPGGLALTVDAGGAVSGEATLLKPGSCVPRKAQIAGHAQGGQVTLTLAFEDGGNSREFVFARRARGAGVDD